MNAIEGPTLKDIKDTIDSRMGKVELDIDKVGVDVSDLKALVEALKLVAGRLEGISKNIKERTDGLPKGFARSGQYKARQ